MSVAVSEKVWAHRGLDATSKLVLLRMAESAQEDGTSIFPSVPRIAADCGIDERTAQRAMARLRDAGLIVLVAEADAARRRAREYRIDLEVLMSGLPPPAQRHPRHNATPGATPPLADGHPRQSATSPPAQRHPTPGVAPPLTVIEPSCNRPNSKRSDKGDPDFEKFWQAYPRKVGKGTARRAWSSAIRKAAVSDIIAAADSFADQVTSAGTEERFIPHPATWLNGERFADGQVAAPALDLLTTVSPTAPDRAEWERRSRLYRDPVRGGWRRSWGPDLLDPACPVPTDLRHLFDQPSI